VIHQRSASPHTPDVMHQRYGAPDVGRAGRISLSRWTSPDLADPHHQLRPSQVYHRSPSPGDSRLGRLSMHSMSVGCLGLEQQALASSRQPGNLSPPVGLSLPPPFMIPTPGLQAPFNVGAPDSVGAGADTDICQSVRLPQHTQQPPQQQTGSFHLPPHARHTDPETFSYPWRDQQFEAAQLPRPRVPVQPAVMSPLLQGSLSVDRLVSVSYPGGRAPSLRRGSRSPAPPSPSEDHHNRGSLFEASGASMASVPRTALDASRVAPAPPRTALDARSLFEASGTSTPSMPAERRPSQLESRTPLPSGLAGLVPPNNLSALPSGQLSTLRAELAQHLWAIQCEEGRRSPGRRLSTSMSSSALPQGLHSARPPPPSLSSLPLGPAGARQADTVRTPSSPASPASPFKVGATRRSAAPSVREDRDDRDLCVVCQDEQRRVVFKPCRHLVCCHGCGNSLQNCPVCRAVVQQRMEVYLS